MDLLSKFKKKKYKFELPSEFKGKKIKFRIWKPHAKGKYLAFKSHIGIEGNKLIFSRKLTIKEKKEYDKLAESISKEQGVPLYSFKCEKCGTLFVLLELGNSLISNKGFRYICKACAGIYG